MSSNPSPIPPLNIQIGPSASDGSLAKVQDLNSGGTLQGNLGLQINTQDIVNIAVEKAETQIRQRVASLQASLSSLTKEQTTLVAENTRYLKEWTRSVCAGDTRIEALTSALKAFNLASDIAYQDAEYTDRTNRISGTISMTCGSRSSYGSAGTKNFCEVVLHYSEAPDAAYTDRLAQIAKLQTEIDSLKKDVFSARSALNNVDALERKAKSVMAQKLVSRSGPAGQEIVAELSKTDVNVDSIIAQLSV